MKPITKQLHSLSHSFSNVLTAVGDEQKLENNILPVKPFLKWVGGKRSILPELLERVPGSYTDYFEPFAGGGALFFALQPEYPTLSDVNFHLVITYTAVRDHIDRVIRNLRIHEKKHSKAYYSKARQRLSTEKDNVKIAALFIYINKTCFNGLYRVNKSGGFNVPMGAYQNPAILDEENLRNVSKALRYTKIYQEDFSQLAVKKNAFYYMDPPYHETYNGYDSARFGDEEHEQLAAFCRKIDRKGGYFMVSNSDTPFVRKLYSGYNIEEVMASRSVSCKAHQRGKKNELIIRNYE